MDHRQVYPYAVLDNRGTPGDVTALDNLLPICARHHSSVHHDDWTLELGARRELTVRFPDGTVRNTGPPRRAAA